MFSKNTSSYQRYIDLGKKGVDLKDFYLNLPKPYRMKTTSGHHFIGDSYAAQYFAFGLAHGGHLDKLLYFYNLSANLKPEVQYAEKILEYGLRAALCKSDLYLYEEVKHMHHNPTYIEYVLKKNIHPDDEAHIKNQLGKIDELNKKIKPPHELIRAINYEIKTILWNDVNVEGASTTERWKGNTSRYPHKYHVLIELKKYLYGSSTIANLKKVIEANPKYDKKAFKFLYGHSDTGKLVEKALLVRGETLSIEKHHPHSFKKR